MKANTCLTCESFFISFSFLVDVFFVQNVPRCVQLIFNQWLLEHLKTLRNIDCSCWFNADKPGKEWMIVFENFLLVWVRECVHFSLNLSVDFISVFDNFANIDLPMCIFFMFLFRQCQVCIGIVLECTLTVLYALTLLIFVFCFIMII